MLSRLILGVLSAFNVYYSAAQVVSEIQFLCYQVKGFSVPLMVRTSQFENPR
jgi:hypothetical protein